MILHLKYPIVLAVLLAPTVRLAAQVDNALAKAAAAKATQQRSDIQKKLASGSEVLKRFRADAFAADGPRIKIAGVFLEFGFASTKDADAKPPFESLQDELREVVRDAVKDVAKDKQLLFDLSGVLRLERDDRLFPRLQRAIAAQTGIDGIRVDAKATFGRRRRTVAGWDSAEAFRREGARSTRKELRRELSRCACRTDCDR